jgi:CRISPR system Cascade subunit CasC
MEEKDGKYRGKRVEFHILQSFPVTCLNRDDVGAPKSADIGGVSRARVSSQSWKRQVRLAMHEFGIKLGVRTKHVAEKVAAYCVEQGSSEETGQNCGAKIASALSKDTLHFFSESEAKALAEYAAKLGFREEDIKEKEVIKVHKGASNPAFDGLDIALFGRMVAQAPDLNIDAACSFSHAISTHKASNELDFFTAVDDYQVDPEEKVTGSAHMGSLEFNSATYYRYIGLDLGQLVENLGDDENLEDALGAFIKALYIAVPAARQTSQTGLSPWDYARVLVRQGQGIQASFEEPVKSRGEGFLKPSIERLNSFLDKKEKLSGSLFGKVSDLQFGIDESFSIDDLIAAVQKAVKA